MASHHKCTGIIWMITKKTFMNIFEWNVCRYFHGVFCPYGQVMLYLSSNYSGLLNEN